MGVPVIASDAVPRPDGVEVFRTGDVHDLANRMRAMMAVETSRTSRGDEDTTPFRDALLAVYRFALDRPRCMNRRGAHLDCAPTRHAVEIAMTPGREA